MATWTSLYIQTEYLDKVEEEILQLVNNCQYEITHNLGNESINIIRSADEGAIPNQLIIGQGQQDWITIRYNNFNCLEDWGTTLSKVFDSYVVVVMAESISMYYYFSVYKSGSKIREIASTEVDNEGFDIEGVNFGEKFDFEEKDTFTNYSYFDFEMIRKYTQELVLNIEFDFNNIFWTLIELDIEKSEEQIKYEELRENLIKVTTRPWWKFW